MRVLSVLLLLPLAGCLGSLPVDDCADVQSHVLSPGLERSWYLGESDPSQPFDHLAVHWDLPEGTQLQASAQVEDVAAETVVTRGDTGALVSHRVEPPGDAFRLHDRTGLSWQACDLDRDWLGIFAAPEPGDVAQVGGGVHVLTAGFFENGTLFYTNMVSVDASPVPRGDGYAWSGSDPLAIFVYDGSTDERLPVWNPTAGTPLAGDPRVGEAPLPEYGVTIAGFNEALKGLSTTTTRVVHVDAEDAYTRPGYEDHPLYGEPLVFMIKAVQVDPLPCHGVMDLCEAPIGLP